MLIPRHFFKLHVDEEFVGIVGIAQLPIEDYLDHVGALYEEGYSFTVTDMDEFIAYKHAMDTGITYIETTELNTIT